MELRHQLVFLRSALPLIAVSTGLALVAALVVSLLLPPTYESTVRLSVGQSTTGGASNWLDDLQVSMRLSQTYAELATTNRIAGQVIAALGLQTTPEELLKHVKSQAALESVLLEITVDDRDPDQATRIANTIADEILKEPASGSPIYQELQAYVEQQLLATKDQLDEVQGQIDRLAALPTLTAAQQTQLDVLSGRAATLRATFSTLIQLSTGAPANQLSIFDPAVRPLEAVAPRPILNTGLGATLGLVLGVALAYTRRRLDDTLRTPEEVEQLTGLPSLGTIVQMPGDNRRPLFYRLATLLYPRSPAAEGFRQVRTSIDFASGDQPPRSLLITSAMPGDGKTTFASNLAIAYAQAGRKVVLVDGDLRKPELHAMFRIPNDSGLTDLLRGHDVPFETIAQPTEVAGLRVIPSGVRPTNPAELVVSGGMPKIIATLLANADMVIIDSPPLQAVTDGTILASQTDGTILVAASGRTRRAALLRGRDSLQRVGARVLGTALNGVSERDGKEAALGYFTYYGDTEAPIDGPGASSSNAVGRSGASRDARVGTNARVGTARPDR